MDKKGRVNYGQTDMLIHVVNNQTNTILDVERCPLPSLPEQFCTMVHELSSDMSLPVSWCFMFCRVIQMIDENKEQLRNLFRTYNVMDVQPAVSDKLPDDISTLQVHKAGIFRNLTQMFCVAVNFVLIFSLLQLVIIILAVLLCLAGFLFVTMNWHYRRV